MIINHPSETRQRYKLIVARFAFGSHTLKFMPAGEPNGTPLMTVPFAGNGFMIGAAALNGLPDDCIVKLDDVTQGSFSQVMQLI